MKIRNKKILLGLLGLSSILVPIAATVVATSCGSTNTESKPETPQDNNNQNNTPNDNPTPNPEIPQEEYKGPTSINDVAFVNMMKRIAGNPEDETVNEFIDFVNNDVSNLRTMISEHMNDLFVNPTQALQNSLKTMNIVATRASDFSVDIKLDNIFVVNDDLTTEPNGSLHVVMTNFAYGFTKINEPKFFNLIFSYLEGPRNNIDSVVNELTTKASQIKQGIADNYLSVFTDTYPSMPTDIVKNSQLQFLKSPTNNNDLEIKLSNVKVLDGNTTIPNKEFDLTTSLPAHEPTSINQPELENILNSILGNKANYSVSEAVSKLSENNADALKQAMITNFSTLFKDPVITVSDMNNVSISVISNKDKVVIKLNNFNYYDHTGELVTNQPFEIITSGYTKTTVFNASALKTWITNTLVPDSASLNAYQLSKALETNANAIKDQLVNNTSAYFTNPPQGLVSGLTNNSVKLEFNLLPNNQLSFDITNAPEYTDGILNNKSKYSVLFDNLVKNATVINVDALANTLIKELSIPSDSNINDIISLINSQQDAVKSALIKNSTQIFSNVPDTFNQMLQTSTITANPQTNASLKLLISDIGYFTSNGDFTNTIPLETSLPLSKLTSNYISVDSNLIDCITGIQTNQIAPMTNFNQELNVQKEINKLITENPWFTNNKIQIVNIGLNQAFDDSVPNEQLSLQIEMKLPKGTKLVYPSELQSSGISINPTTITSNVVTTNILKPVQKPDSDFPLPNPTPRNVAELNKWDYRSIAKMPVYNGKELGFSTFAKNQKKDGLCWAFSDMAAAESSALREGIITSHYNARFSVRNFDYTSKVYNSGLDILGLNPGQEWKAGEFGSGWMSRYGSPAIGLTRGLGPTEYSMFTENSNTAWQSYKAPVVRLENYIDIDCSAPLEVRNRNLKLALAKYGAVTVGVGTLGGYLKETYVKFEKPGYNHAVTIVGWDDTINKDLFWTGNGPNPAPAPKPTSDGAWLVKNSFGPSYPAPFGYFWLSYDSGLGGATTFDYAPANQWDNTYYYDATLQSVAQSVTTLGQRTANIFPALKASTTIDETLVGTNIVTPADYTDLVVKVYVNNTANTSNIDDPTNNPESGQLVAIKRETLVGSGDHTVYFDTPVSLPVGGNYSIVVEPQKVSNNNYLGTSTNETSTNDMSFGYFPNEGWKNLKVKSNTVARIKGLTKESKRTAKNPPVYFSSESKDSKSNTNLYESLTNTWSIKQEVSKYSNLALFYDLLEA